MKLFNAIAATAAVVGTSFIAVNPAEARNGWIMTTTNEELTRYIKITSKDGQYIEYQIYHSNFENPKPLSAYADCQKWRFRYTHRTDSDWIDVMPMSIGEHEFENYICK